MYQTNTLHLQGRNAKLGKWNENKLVNQVQEKVMVKGPMRPDNQGMEIDSYISTGMHLTK
jgi:hypothetical protein